MDGKIEIDPLITHTMALENINRAFDVYGTPESQSAAWCGSEALTAAYTEGGPGWPDIMT